MERPKLLGVKEASEIIGVSSKRLRVLVSKKRIHAQLVNSTWIFFEEDVIEFSKKQRNHGRPKKS